MAMNIQLCEQDKIDLYAETGRDFFKDVLGIGWDECLVTDESALSDFSSCGMPDTLSEGAATLADLYDRWDAWVIPKIMSQYSVALANTRILLVDLFARIEAKKTPVLVN